MVAQANATCYCAVQHKRDRLMSEHNLPKEPTPLSPWEYWRESLQTWADYSQQTSKIVINQIGGARDVAKKMDPEADTLATDLLRSLSDMNLRHWQNTARLLESYPAWMQIPHSLTGSALVDWFDAIQRQSGKKLPSASDAPDAVSPTEHRPKTLTAPNGAADDLTCIKGIGPKMSGRLNELGIFHLRQIANWTDQEVLWVDSYLASKGRVAREGWVSQARILSAKDMTTVH